MPLLFSLATLVFTASVAQQCFCDTAVLPKPYLLIWDKTITIVCLTYIYIPCLTVQSEIIMRYVATLRSYQSVAGGCRMSVRHWEIWMLLRWTHACTEQLRPCESDKSCSATAPKRWPRLATMPCSKGTLHISEHSYHPNANVEIAGVE